MNLEKLKNHLPSESKILQKEEYFNSAVLIPIIKLNNEYHFVFEKRAANIRQGSEICFPGGEYEPVNDENYQFTALRETEEELGINNSKIDVLGYLGTLIGPMGVTVDGFIGILNYENLDEFNFDKNEVEKLFTVPVSFFVENEPETYHVRMEVHPTDVDENGQKYDTLPVKDLQLPDRYSRPWRGRKHKVLVYKSNGEVIWGITAMLIYEVVKLLK